ncbi:hypothetical protein ACFFON_10240 [Arthrobacter citreus]|uniref:hypothetical protein n=1 Tax=Arthrobacter citreus TaxID=1670 RepID=UPI0031F9912A
MLWIFEVFLVLLAAFLGTFFAFSAERWQRKREAEFVEVQALNNLIVDLHLRRSFRPLDPVAVPGGSEDAQYVTEAVFEISTQLRDTRLKLRPTSEQHFDQLVRMSSACNRYLSKYRRDPAEYQFHLHELRGLFCNAVERLSETEKVLYMEPGGGNAPSDGSTARAEVGRSLEN